MQEKGSVYSGSSVSLMVKRGPGLAPGTTVDVHGLQADRASSFAESATASVPDFVDSRSLVSILAGNPARRAAQMRTCKVGAFRSIEREPLPPEILPAS